jgi:hypothetical protein
MGNCLSISRRHERTKTNSDETESASYIPTTKLIAGGNDVTLSTSAAPVTEANEIESLKPPRETPRLEPPIEPRSAKGFGGFGGCEGAAGGGGAEPGADERAGRSGTDWGIGGGGCA